MQFWFSGLIKKMYIIAYLIFSVSVVSSILDKFSFIEYDLLR